MSRRLERHVAELERRVMALEAAARGDADERFVRTLAGVIAASGGAIFSAADLRQHARIDRELRQVLAGASTKAIGKRLRRLAGHPLAGIVLTPVGRDAHGVIWSVQVAADLHRPAGGPSRPGV